MNTYIPAFLMAYSDSSFTNPHEVVLPDDPPECTGNFTHMGAKYWGLESKRHKATTVLTDEQALSYDHNAHNWFTIGFKERAEVSKLTISTKWFTGNQVRAVTVSLIDGLTGQETMVLDRAPLDPDAEHSFEVDTVTATEARVDCYYEGGISRVNFFGTTAGEQLPEPKNILEGAEISYVSNDHYGDPAMAVKGCRKEMHMVGWESARTGFGEQALFTLKSPTVIDEIVIDTYLHRLNPPLTAHVFGASEGDMTNAPRWKLLFANGDEIIPDDFQAYMLTEKYLAVGREFKIQLHVPDDVWQPILPFAPLEPDTYHRFKTLEAHEPVTHILYMHYPNGGIHGLKMFGRE